MRSNNISSGGIAKAYQVNANSDNNIVFLTSEASFYSINWNVNTIKTNTKFYPYKVTSGVYAVDKTRFLLPQDKMALSGTENNNKWEWYSSSITWRFKDYNDNLYKSILFRSSTKDFKVDLSSNSSAYPIAKPYFLAEHTWRTLGSSNFGTICFPKAVRTDEVAGATFYEIEAKIVDNGEFKGVVLNEVTGDLAAGTPYIFKRASDATYIVAAMHGDAAKATSHNGLVGTLTGSEEDGSFEVPAGMYILQGDQLWLTTTGQSRLLAGRAYINPASITKKVTSANASLVKGIVLGTDAPADGIRSTKVTKGAQGVAFDLQGRPAARPQHGHTYLINGHKVYIK